MTSAIIRWGIVGAGQVAHGFADGLASLPDAELVAVSSRRASTATSFAHRHGPLRVHADAAALAADPDVDVIYVATPNHRHMDDALTCLGLGKPILVEKPFALDAEQARSIVGEARRRQLFCMEAMWMRFIPAIRHALELTESGAIGEIQAVHADFSIVTAFDPTNRLFDRAQGGGALLDLGVYGVSLAQLLLGDPTRVDGMATIGDSGVDEHVAALLSGASAGTAMVTAGIRSAGPNQAVISGTSGSIVLPGPICAPSSLIVTKHRKPEASVRLAESNGTGGVSSRVRSAVRASPRASRFARSARRTVSKILRRGPRTMQLPITGNGYNYEAAEVMRCLRSGDLESPVIPLDDTIVVMETLDRIRDSWSAGNAQA